MTSRQRLFEPSLPSAFVGNNAMRFSQPTINQSETLDETGPPVTAMRGYKLIWLLKDDLLHGAIELSFKGRGGGLKSSRDDDIRCLACCQPSVWSSDPGQATPGKRFPTA
jgi:hypothetical protein